MRRLAIQPIEELTQLTPIPHVVAVQTDEVLEDVEPPKEPPEMSDVEQALTTPMDHGLHQEHCGQQQAARAPPQCSLQTRILNERISKKLPATAQQSLMSQSGRELRESQQRSSTSAARSSTAGGLSVPSFFQQ
jgi:hypothetical protein